MQYFQKPIAVEAIKFNGTRKWDEAPDWLIKATKKAPDVIGSLHVNDDRTATINTRAGFRFAVPGDWIVRGAHGEITPFKPDLFAATYEANEPASGLQLIAAERERQKAKGFTSHHDDQHRSGEIADAASCYAQYSSCLSKDISPDEIMDLSMIRYPWEDSSFRPDGKIDCMVKSAALAVAEIERLQRLGED